MTWIVLDSNAPIAFGDAAGIAEAEVIIETKANATKPDRLTNFIYSLLRKVAQSIWRHLIARSFNEEAGKKLQSKLFFGKVSQEIVREQERVQLMWN